MFVGIAQIIVACLSGARLQPAAAWSGPLPHSSAAGAPPPRPDAQVRDPEPRPHSDYEALKPPAPPPDRRYIA